MLEGIGAHVTDRQQVKVSSYCVDALRILQLSEDEAAALVCFGSGHPDKQRHHPVRKTVIFVIFLGGLK